MKKITGSLLVIGIIIALSVGCLSVAGCFYKSWVLEGYIDNELITYTTGKMVQYDGGEEALQFFPAYQDVDSNVQLYFHYQDNRIKSNFFHEYQSFFLLDMVYSPEDYLLNKETLDSSVELSTYDDYVVAYQEQADTIYKVIFTNDNTNTIRYVLFYGHVDAIPVEALMAWNVPL